MRWRVVKKFFGTTAILCGTIIGVGIFGLPWVAQQAGLAFVSLYLAWGTFAAIVAALVFGELMYRTKGHHRLPGYVAKYLGRRWGRWVMVSALSGLFGAQLVYLLVGGHFLAQLLTPWWPAPEAWYIGLYAAAGALLITGSGKNLARSELVLLPIFLTIMAVIIWQVLPLWSFSHLVTWNFSQAVLPYGVVMFSIWGLSAVGESRDYLGQADARLLKPAVITSFLLCAVVYVVFTAAILAASGTHTTPDTLGGLRVLLGSRWVQLFYFFGLLTTFTSYISFGLTLKKIFVYDAGLTPRLSWTAAVVVPPLLFVAGVTNFIALMAFVGAVTLGFDTISLMLAYRQAVRHAPAMQVPYRLNLTPKMVSALNALFGIGICSTVVYLVLQSGR